MDSGNRLIARAADDPVVAWLLDAAPPIRWQVLCELIGAPSEIVAAERSRVAAEGWGPRLLDQQRPDGQWGDGIDLPFWWTNLYTLLYLRDLGIDPACDRARTAIDRLRDNVTWGPESEIPPSSRAKSSRASTAAWLRSARILVRAAIDLSIGC